MEGLINECDLSCDPVDPRRSLVPGPESVKLVTEDCIEVGNQASVTVTATGNTKKFVQQAFHPSLFLSRPRSSSVGNPANPNNSTNTTQADTIRLSKPTTDANTPCPPEWQRVPTGNNRKRKKIAQSPSPEGVKTSNRFNNLPIDLTEDDAEPKIKKPSKPPPIVLYGVEDVKKLTELLETVAERNQFTYKIVSQSQLRISCSELDVYKKLISLIREKGIIGHTFNRKDQKLYRIVIRNLHHSTPHTAIVESVENTGNKVAGEIINVRHGPDKKPTSTFFVNIEPGPNNTAVKNIKHIYHQTVIIEDPRKRKTIVQCQRCQQYGHSKNFCMRPYRCVKCAKPHKTSDCPKLDRTTPAQCALCEGAHPANYKGCEVYKEILARRMPRRNKPHDKPSEPREKSGPHTVTPGNPKVTLAPPATNKTKDLYSDALKKQPEQIQAQNSLEEILTKQTEKFELILQQMSTLMSLITTLINKLWP